MVSEQLLFFRIPIEHPLLYHIIILIRLNQGQIPRSHKYLVRLKTYQLEFLECQADKIYYIRWNQFESL